MVVDQFVGTFRSRRFTLRCAAIGCRYENVSNHAFKGQSWATVPAVHTFCRYGCHFLTSHHCPCTKQLPFSNHCLASCMYCGADLSLLSTMYSNMITITQSNPCVEREKYHQRCIQSRAERYRACYHGVGSPQRTIWSRHAPEPQKSASKASCRPRRRGYKGALPAFQRHDRPLDDRTATLDINTADSSRTAAYEHG